MEQNKRHHLMLGQDNNSLTWLIIINAVVFIILAFIRVIYIIDFDKEADAVNAFHTQVLDWFTLSPGLSTFITRPWTLLVYMFSHENILHVISSLLWLWAFGYILQDLTGNSKLIPIYLYGGVAGAVCFLITARFSGAAYPLIGAGASVMAVVVATTAIQPGYRIFPMLNGGIPLWILTVIFAAIDFASLSKGYDGAANSAAHLGGAIAGFIFVTQLRRGKDPGRWMGNFLYWIDDLFNPEKKHKKQPVKQKHFYKAEKKPYSKTPHITQQKLDEILDKINQQGYHLLTDDEKEFLKKASREDF